MSAISPEKWRERCPVCKGRGSVIDRLRTLHSCWCCSGAGTAPQSPQIELFEMPAELQPPTTTTTAADIGTPLQEIRA